MLPYRACGTCSMEGWDLGGRSEDGIESPCIIAVCM